MKIITIGIKNPVHYIFKTLPTEVKVVFQHDPYKGRNYRLITSEGLQLRTLETNQQPIVDFKSEESALKLAEKLNKKIKKL